MPFLSPNQQHQCAEGNIIREQPGITEITHSLSSLSCSFTIHHCTLLVCRHTSQNFLLHLSCCIWLASRFNLQHTRGYFTYLYTKMHCINLRLLIYITYLVIFKLKESNSFLNYENLHQSHCNTVIIKGRKWYKLFIYSGVWIICNNISEYKWIHTIIKSLDHNSSHINSRFHLYPVWTAGYLLVGKEDVCRVSSNCCGFKLNAERVVLVVYCFHRHVKTTLIGQGNCNVTYINHIDVTLDFQQVLKFYA